MGNHDPAVIDYPWLQVRAHHLGQDLRLPAGYRLRMSENERLIHASVEDVFAVLTDGWSYASWVVGASRIRDKDSECHLLMRERAAKGPATLIPEAMIDPVLRLRNAETLERLALLAERRNS